MKLFKKNKGLAILEFVMVMPLFLVIISCINDIASLIRVKGTLESLAESVVNVPFQVLYPGQSIDKIELQANLVAATKAFVSTYGMYSTKASKKLVFCWSGIEFRDNSDEIVCSWRMWYQNGKETLGKNDFFGGCKSTVVPKSYIGALKTGVGAVLVLEVFLDISGDMQFINFFKMFSVDTIQVKVFSIPNSRRQMPHLMDSSTS